MQQAYRVLRIVSEAQTIRIVLVLAPDELMLKELCTACAALNTDSSKGIKAVVLDFETKADTSGSENAAFTPDTLDQACAAVRAVEAPVLAVVRGKLSAGASALVHAADLTLLAHDAVLMVQDMADHKNHPEDARAVSLVGNDRTDSYNVQRSDPEGYTGVQALRLKLITWSVPANEINAEMERILDMLRGKSAVALRHTKASVRLAAHAASLQQEKARARLEALKQVNEFYLAQVMQTADASEGLHAFLEKRKPEWKNR
jgi:enoyl-CoA hydratase/carnithine racemase